MNSRNEWWRFTGVTLLAAVGAGIVTTVDPNQAGHYPTCPFLAVTGLYCPGCGSLRALHALLRLDPATAAQRNPLTLVVVVLLTAIWIAWLRRLTGVGTFHPVQVPARLLWVGLVLVLSFWVARNLPGWTALSPV